MATVNGCNLPGGTVVASKDTLNARPSSANADPRGEGWPTILKPEDWDSVKGGLVAGSQVAGPYDAKMTAGGFA